MNKFFGHLKTVCTHKFGVFHYAVKLGIPVRGLLHDISKFHPIEFFEGVKYAKPNNRLSDISHAIEEYVKLHKYSVVRDFTGHGIGRHLHEDPMIPNYGEAGHGPLLKAGMVLAIEPMVNAGRYHVRILADDWTTVTVDRSDSAHYEHTIVITENGCEILTIEEDK